MRLPMYGHKHVPLRAEPRRNGLHLGCIPAFGMTYLVEANVQPHPVDLCLFRPYAVVQVADTVTQLIEQAPRGASDHLFAG